MLRICYHLESYILVAVVFMPMSVFYRIINSATTNAPGTGL